MGSLHIQQLVRLDFTLIFAAWTWLPCFYSLKCISTCPQSHQSLYKSHYMLCSLNNCWFWQTLSNTIISETSMTKNQWVTRSVHNHWWDLRTIIREISCHFYHHWWDQFSLFLDMFDFHHIYLILIRLLKKHSCQNGIVFDVIYLFLLPIWKFPVSLMIVPVSPMIVQSHRWLFFTNPLSSWR